jgi:hypothetical protein
MRDEFYRVDGIDVDEIKLDVENYRFYGELRTQEDCVNAMLNNITESKIDVLAQDIAIKGLSPEHILLSKGANNCWVVREGNRRILTLKILNNPSMINNLILQRKFKQIISSAQKDIPKYIDCIASDDEELILEYIKKVHSGSDGGAGRIQWNSGQKTYFEQASGRSGDNARAIVLLEVLAKYGYEYSLRAKYITTIQRLVASREPMENLGIKFDRNKRLMIAIDEGEFLAIAKTIFDDFSTGDKNVSDVYNLVQRVQYVSDLLARLDIVLDIGDYFYYDEITQPVDRDKDKDKAESKADDKPSNPSELSEPSESTDKPSSPDNGYSTPQSPRGKPKKPSYERKRVINVGIKIDRYKYPKIHNVYNELRLIPVEDTPLAAAMSLRVFIELSVLKFINDHHLLNQSDNEPSLKEGWNKCNVYLREAGKINSDEFEDYDNLRHTNVLLNVRTLQRYIHSLNKQPHYTEVNILWDNIQRFILLLWE